MTMWRRRRARGSKGYVEMELWDIWRRENMIWEDGCYGGGVYIVVQAEKRNVASGSVDTIDSFWVLSHA